MKTFVQYGLSRSFAARTRARSTRSNSSQRHFRITTALVAAFVLTPSEQSFAQAAPATAAQSTNKADASSNSDTIVVTANKLGSDLRHAPISAISVDAQTIAKLHVQSLQDVQIRAPSLVYDAFTGVGQAYIRGIGTNQSYAGLESSVATYIDGVYLQRQTGSTLDVVDLASIQVLNGPQGALYGRNATGGVILVNTADPTQTFGGHIQAEAGNLGHYSIEAVLNVPLTSNLAFRVAGRYFKSDGYVTNVADGEKLLGREYGTIRAKLKWTPSDRLTVTASADYHNETAKTQAGHQVGPASLCTACVVFNTAPPPANQFYSASVTPGQQPLKLPFGGVSLTLGYKADDFTISSVTAFRKSRWSFFADQDFASGDLLNNTAVESGSTFTQETYLRTHFHGPFNFLAGFTGEHDVDRLTIALFGAAFGPVQDVGDSTRVKLDSVSAYGEAEYVILPGLKFTAGARYNIDRKVLDAVNNIQAQTALGAPPVFNTRKTFRDFTPRGVLSYQTGSTNIYASIGRGAKSGGFSAPAFTPLSPLQSERLTSYEIGVKTGLLDNKLRIEAAGFYYNYKDIQVTFVNAVTGAFISENAASARSYGFEMTANLSVTHALTLSAGGLVLDSKFRDYPRAGAFFPSSEGFTAGAIDLGGTTLPRAPKFSGTISADYSVDLTPAWSLALSAADRYTSGYFFSAGGGGPLELDRQNGYHMGRASLAFSNKPLGLEVRFYVDNAFGEKYRLTAATSALAAYYLAAPPRTYGISTRIDF